MALRTAGPKCTSRGYGSHENTSHASLRACSSQLGGNLIRLPTFFLDFEMWQKQSVDSWPNLKYLNINMNISNKRKLILYWRPGMQWSCQWSYFAAYFQPLLTIQIIYWVTASNLCTIHHHPQILQQILKSSNTANMTNFSGKSRAALSVVFDSQRKGSHLLQYLYWSTKSFGTSLTNVYLQYYLPCTIAYRVLFSHW